MMQIAISTLGPTEISPFTVTLDGIPMVFQTMSTSLGQRVNESTWATRAWTYQEAALSPRCIYFSSDQLYFECNLFQSCESIDTKMSPRHTMTFEKLLRKIIQSPEEASDYAFFLLNSGIYRNFSAWSTFAYLIPRTEKTERQISTLYFRLVEVYSKRVSTLESDALDAINAIFTKLREVGLFPTGFHWGLPLDRFEEALIWSWRGSSDVRRDDFPSWSWLGWKGEINRRRAYAKEYVFPLAFSAWKLSAKDFERLVPGSTFNKDQIPGALLEAPTIIPWLSDLNAPEAARLLVVKGYVLRLPVLKPSPSKENSIRMALFGHVVELLCDSHSMFLDIMALGREETEYLSVLRVNTSESWGVHFFAILGQARTTDDADNCLIAEYAGWFGLIHRKFEIFNRNNDSEVAIELRAHQELRTVFIR
jgi:hypothetical protein